MVTKSSPEPSGGEWQSQQSDKFKVLATIREKCTRAFSFLRKAPGWF